MIAKTKKTQKKKKKNEFFLTFCLVVSEKSCTFAVVLRKINQKQLLY